MNSLVPQSLFFYHYSLLSVVVQNECCHYCFLDSQTQGHFRFDFHFKDFSRAYSTEAYFSTNFAHFNLIYTGYTQLIFQLIWFLFSSYADLKCFSKCDLTWTIFAFECCASKICHFQKLRCFEQNFFVTSKPSHCYPEFCLLAILQLYSLISKM